MFFNSHNKSITVQDEKGKYIVTLKYPHFFPVTRKCHVPETRRILETAYQAKCTEENTGLLEEILDLRHKEAQLLGYVNHASYAQVRQIYFTSSQYLLYCNCVPCVMHCKHDICFISLENTVSIRDSNKKFR